MAARRAGAFRKGAALCYATHRREKEETAV